MKFINNSRTILAGSMLLAMAVFGLSMAAFPSSAQAQFYTAGSAYGTYNCAFPTVYQNGYWTCSTGSVTYVQPTYQQPQPQYPQYPQQQQLSVSCYPNSTSATTGQTVQWVASPMGGNQSYTYSWSGTDGLSGTSQTASMAYYSAGTKTGQVTVYSGGQTQTASCNNFVTVYNNQQPQYPTYPVYPTYPTVPNYYSPLAASCVVNTNYSPLGTAVTWSASATGGNGYYNYSWSGTDGVYGYGQAISYTYNSPGTKYASVTVTSNGQTITHPCSNFVTVGGPSVSGYYGYSTSYNSNSSGLDVACYPDPSTASVNQPVNWRAEVTGGNGQYTYSWTGTSDLTGTGPSVIKYYSTAGSKSAIVTVTSSDGRASTRACSATLTVRGATAAPAPVEQQPTRVTSSQTNLTGASIFSLSGIPWGWVAVLIILVLFATVMYLLFNKPKI